MDKQMDNSALQTLNRTGTDTCRDRTAIAVGTDTLIMFFTCCAKKRRIKKQLDCRGSENF